MYINNHESEKKEAEKQTSKGAGKSRKVEKQKAQKQRSRKRKKKKFRKRRKQRKAKKKSRDAKSGKAEKQKRKKQSKGPGFLNKAKTEKNRPKINNHPFCLVRYGANSHTSTHQISFDITLWRQNLAQVWLVVEVTMSKKVDDS